MPVTDKNKIPGILDELRTLKNLKVRVGPAATEGSQLDIIARVNEFGVQIDVTEDMRNFLAAKGLYLKGSTSTITVPERSFLRTTTDNTNTHNKIAETARSKLNEVLVGNATAQDVMKEIGSVVAEEIKTTIDRGIGPENHPFTTEQKGNNKTLQDTGSLKESISYEVSV